MSGAHPTGRFRILIVDDHALVRAGLAELIEAEPDLEVCGQAAEAPAALDLIAKTHPHLVVVDLVLKEGSGLDLIKQIKAIDPTIRMIVSSMHDERIYGERALAAGAMGYVEKDQPVEVLLAAIRRVLAGEISVSDRLSGRILRRVSGSGKESSSPVESLSDRELEVLELIGRGQTTRAIADRLNLSTKTIDTYRENLKSKLGLKTANELIAWAVSWVIDPGSGTVGNDPSTG